VNKQSPIGWAPLRALAEINFLHFAIFLFVICVGVLFFVSLATTPPELAKVQGLTFRHAGEARGYSKGRAATWNIAFSILLVLSVLTLWYIFF
jgi:SSS family solute:Na+ symporter